MSRYVNIINTYRLNVGHIAAELSVPILHNVTHIHCRYPDPSFRPIHGRCS